MAFEKDLIALYLASFQTAEITTKNGKGGKSWIDASKGIGDKLNTSELRNQARLYPFRMLG